MAEMTRIEMTSSEYWALPETNQIEELIEGELVVTPPPLDAHQKSSNHTHGFLYTELKTGELRHAPTGVHFEDGSDFEPDIFWVSPHNDHCYLSPDGRYWHGAPDLVVEILSPSTAYRDRGIKFETYEKYGVREYWLVDPDAQFVEIYRLENERFSRLGIFQSGQAFVSDILGGVTVEVKALLG